MSLFMQAIEIAFLTPDLFLFPVSWSVMGMQPLRVALIGCVAVTAVGGILYNPLFQWANTAVTSSPLLQEAIAQRDYPLVQGIVVVIAALVVMVNLAVDVVVALLDPRLKF